MSSVPDKNEPLRGGYVLLTRQEIEALRYRFSRGMHYEATEIETLCDMAVNALLYGEEIDRLRALPSAIGAIDKERKRQLASDLARHCMGESNPEVLDFVFKNWRAIVEALHD